MKTRSDSLRRKAYRLHRKADAARSNRKVFDAAQFKAQALDLEARADLLDAEEGSDFVGAGFRDADLDRLTGCTALPRGFGGVR